MPEYYFAYGNNMLLDTMEKRCGPQGEHYRWLGLGKIRGYRISFQIDATTANLTSTTGVTQLDGRVSTIIACPADEGWHENICVYGVLYELYDDHVLQQLAPHEGSRFRANTEQASEKPVEPQLYKITQRRVLPCAPEGAQEVKAYAFIGVDDKQDADGKPDPTYLGRLVKGARKAGAPVAYTNFLKSLEKFGTDHDVQRSRIALPTTLRTSHSGWPTAALSPADTLAFPQGARVGVFNPHATGLELEEGGITRSKDGARETGCPCEVVHAPIPQHTVRLDEKVRRLLDLPALEPSREIYGARVQILPADNMSRPLIQRLSGIHPRTLVLPTNYSSVMDSDQNVVVLHPRIQEFIGIEPGDYVRLIACVREDENSSRATGRCIRLRALSGSQERVRIDGAPPLENYPHTGEVHLDASGRAAMELPAGLDGLACPVLVAPSVRHLISKRIIVYTIPLLVLPSLMGELTARLNLGQGSLWPIILSFAVAFVVGLWLVLLDIRGRAHHDTATHK